MERQSVLAYVLTAIAAGAWFTSLQLPAISYWTEHSANFHFVDSGYDLFRTGFMGIFLLNIAWYANLLGLLALAGMLAGRWAYGVTGTIALMAFALGLDTYDFDVRPTGEGVATSHVYQLLSGFYVWEASFLILALSQFLPLLIQLARARPAV